MRTIIYIDKNQNDIINGQVLLYQSVVVANIIQYRIDRINNWVVSTLFSVTDTILIRMLNRSSKKNAANILPTETL